MKKRFLSLRSILAALICAFTLSLALPSCGTIRTHAGIEHDYRFDFDDYGHHHHKKPKKHKHKKYKKHKHHHHHHDD